MKKIWISALIIIGMVITTIVKRIIIRNIEFRFADTVAVDQVERNTNAYKIMESQDELTLIVSIIFWVLMAFGLTLLYRVWFRKKKTKIEG